MAHYRCYTVVMKKTGFVRISDTVRFIHHINPKPTITPAYRVADATNNLVNILKRAAEDIPQSQLEAIATLRKVLKVPSKQAPTEPSMQQDILDTSEDSTEAISNEN